MGFPWREVVTAAATVGGTTFAGPFGPVIGATVHAMVKKDKQAQDRFVEWGEELERLEADEEISNEEKFEMLFAKVSFGMFEDAGRKTIPKRREVNFVIETLLGAFKGEPTIAVPSVPEDEVEA